jgi:hypothetical protein
MHLTGASLMRTGTRWNRRGAVAATALGAAAANARGQRLMPGPTPAPPAAVVAAPVPFSVGEELTYAAAFAGMAVGMARMRVDDVDVVRGRDLRLRHADQIASEHTHVLAAPNTSRTASSESFARACKQLAFCGQASWDASHTNVVRLASGSRIRAEVAAVRSNVGVQNQSMRSVRHGGPRNAAALPA